MLVYQGVYMYIYIYIYMYIYIVLSVPTGFSILNHEHILVYTTQFIPQKKNTYRYTYIVCITIFHQFLVILLYTTH